MNNDLINLSTGLIARQSTVASLLSTTVDGLSTNYPLAIYTQKVLKCETMMPEKVLARARWLASTAFALVFAALAGCDRSVVSPNETRGESDAHERRLEDLKTDAKALRRADGESARALAEARKRGAPAEEIAALEKKAAKAHADFKRNIEVQKAVCEERRLAEESQK